MWSDGGYVNKLEQQSDVRHSASYSNFSSRHSTMATRKSGHGSRQVDRSVEEVRLSPGSRERATRPGVSKEHFEDKSNFKLNTVKVVSSPASVSLRIVLNA
ncbi:hypothetical protein OS493_008870 [Desmophyllum pertusum]|uniref:Uncharacterized protein n=1 Tax=Desmophyllum pertusum TaxID=174260 RepID=A0A9X0CZR9_9CNID|nr:hypothetical protein OS493_008870 [Desmophyllum pertusum]